MLVWSTKMELSTPNTLN